MDFTMETPLKNNNKADKTPLKNMVKLLRSPLGIGTLYTGC